MSASSPRIVVIGGGATGLGVIWDLALRGIRATLVEQGDLCHGTSGRFHGLLHSGGRYAVRDPRSAEECIRENRVLRRVAGPAVEPVGGYFLALPEDDPAYVRSWRAGCEAAGIPVRPVDPAEFLRREPRANPRVATVFAVPDASIDSFRLAQQLVAGARRLGARILTRHRVVAARAQGGRVVGVEVENAQGRVTLDADMVINAAGPWARRVGHVFGVEIPMVLAKGSHLIFNERLSSAVLNRLIPPDDGDILVPHDVTSILATTSLAVDEPEDVEVTEAEVSLLLERGEALVPGVSGRRVLRAFAGVRPLFDPEGSPGGMRDERAITRGLSLLDHEERDGLGGLISIVGGKLTTFRLMAETAVDLALERMGLVAACRTRDTPLPGAHSPDPVPLHLERARRRLGPLYPSVLDRLRADPAQGALLCECEQVTVAEIDARAAGSRHMSDLRRQTWCAMGPCQGTFCAHRLAGRVDAPAEELVEFVTERWRGQRPVLWGQQAREAAVGRSLMAQALWPAGAGW